MLETRGWISLFLGIITTLIGAIPLAHSFNWIAFNLPFTVAGMILYIILIIGGLFLLFDSAHEDHIKKMITIVLGLIFVAVGGLALLFIFNVIGFDLFSFKAIDIIVNVILVLGGVFLIFGSGD